MSLISLRPDYPKSKTNRGGRVLITTRLPNSKPTWVYKRVWSEVSPDTQIKSLLAHLGQVMGDDGGGRWRRRWPAMLPSTARRGFGEDSRRWQRELRATTADQTTTRVNNADGEPLDDDDGTVSSRQRSTMELVSPTKGRWRWRDTGIWERWRLGRWSGFRRRQTSARTQRQRTKFRRLETQINSRSEIDGSGWGWSWWRWILVGVGV